MKAGDRPSSGMILLLGLTLGAATVAAAPGGLRAEAPPNIVLILADDLGWHDASFNGRKEWSTPNLDALASRGTVFRRFYAAAVVCAPSRAALLTGKDTIHDGVSRNDEDLPASEVTLAEALKARGYATGLFGKWHHGKPRTKGGSYVHPMDQGFDEFFGFTDATHAWEKYPTELWDGRAKRPVEGYADDLFAARALDFIERHKDGPPFFAYVPFTATHFQIEAPETEVGLYRGKFAEGDPEHPVNATYAAMVARLDANVGSILGALDRLDLTRRTIIVFTSDHGATFEASNLGASNYHDSNAPFRGQKRTLWEGGLRVPAVVSCPGRYPAGRTSDAVLRMTDLFPTLLAAAGGEPDPFWRVDGANVLPLWSGGMQLADRTLFWEWRSEGNNQLAALRGNHKLVITNDGRPELFDVEADPAERRNIAAQLPEITKRLRGELNAWLASEVKFESH
jgi:arylsulfatase A-like enzyme